MFFFKKSEVVVDCFTSRSEVFEYSKPQPAVNLHPSWWRSLPNPRDIDNTNMRYCPGYVELYRRGFMTTLWTDTKIFVSGNKDPEQNWSIDFTDGRSQVDHHTNDQYMGFYPNNKCITLKLASPWFMKTKVKLDFLILDAAFNRTTHDLYFVPAGYINFYAQASANSFLFFMRGDKDTYITLDAGTPLNHFVPLSDKKVKLAYHLVSEKEIIDLAPRPIMLYADYYRKLRLKGAGK